MSSEWSSEQVNIDLEVFGRFLKLVCDLPITDGRYEESVRTLISMLAYVLRGRNLQQYQQVGYLSSTTLDCLQLKFNQIHDLYDVDPA